MRAECNVEFFATLLRKNISTRDIHSFLLKQAKLRKVYKGLDKPLSRVATRSKLNDACSFIHRQRRLVNRLKLDVLKATGNRRYKQIKIIGQVKSLIRAEKTTQRENDKVKISRYEELQSEMNLQKSIDEFKIPASIAQFKEIKAFKPPTKPEIVQDLPMVYDNSIQLSEDELKILSKGPKFAVRERLLEENFKLELEKAVCKQKFNDPQVLELSPSLSKESSFSGQESIVSKEIFQQFVPTNDESESPNFVQTKSNKHGMESNSIVNHSEIMFEERKS